jgi:hypothetical protein
MQTYQTYHIPPEQFGPDHAPLTEHELRQLMTARQEHIGDFYVTRSILRRIEQAVPGMTYPTPHDGPVAYAATRAIAHFIQAADQHDVAAFEELCRILEIGQRELLEAV